MGYQACLSEIRAAAGLDLTDRDLEGILSAVLDRVERARRAGRPGLDENAMFRQAAEELSVELRAAAAIEKRNAALNLVKRVGRRAFYESAPAAGKRPGPLMGLEAKLVGVNTPFAGSRLSVDAQGIALRRDYLVGLATDLDRAGLFEIMRKGTLDREWARELFELSRADGKGRPGVSGSEQARAIATIVHRYQRLAVDNLNRAGAWIGSYDGYISRTSHDADKLRRAGFSAWRDRILPLLDERTFEGIEDPDGFLRGVHAGLVTGVHLTQEGMQGFKAPAFVGPGNLAKKLAQGRVLHFRDADAWLDYHDAFGVGTLSESVLHALDQAARNTALMREFGTNPRAEFEADLAWLEETHRADGEATTRLRQAAKAMTNRFDELDGTARMPVHRLAARIGAGVRAWASMSKLGGVVISSITDVPFKAAELRYQGINLLERQGDGLTALFRGRGKGETRAVMDLLRAGAEGMVGSVAARFDAADTVPGRLSKIGNVFFRFTGLTYWTDAQRAGAEFVMARHLGKMTERSWAELPAATRRVLTLFDIGGRDWELVRAAELANANGRRYLTPDAALRVPDAAIEAQLREQGKLAEGAEAATRARALDDWRRDLALKLHAYFADRGEHAVIQPRAREFAILRQGTRPGTPEGEALRFIGQFKAFPVAVLTRALGRELHGGGSRMGAVAGIVHMMVASTMFGYLAMSAKDLAKGRAPRDPTDPKTWAAAFVQGGGAGIYGDFIVGDFNRFGRSLLASLAGPTFGQIDDVAELWNRLKRGDDTAAQAFRMVLGNTPFVNLFYTRIILDYLVLYQIQEALNPGFLRRFERRVAEENKQRFLLKPSQAIPHGGGDRIFEGVR